MTVVGPAPAASLAALLRQGSQAEHREAERSSFMSELVAGRVDARGYTHYLSLLRRVYEALESTAGWLACDPLASVVIDPALARLAAIDADLAHWGEGAVPVHESPATDAYVDRVIASASWGGLFVAHHYTRYLGDLSGGQVIGRLLTREFDLDGAGVAFYEFPGIPRPKDYKDDYRARLDGLVIDQAQCADVLDEVKAVFALNGALFAELGERLDDYRR